MARLAKICRRSSATTRKAKARTAINSPFPWPHAGVQAAHVRSRCRVEPAVEIFETKAGIPCRKTLSLAGYTALGFRRASRTGFNEQQPRGSEPMSISRRTILTGALAAPAVIAAARLGSAAPARTLKISHQFPG